MAEEPIENAKAAAEEDNEPIYYRPRVLSFIATLSVWTSWIVLLVFILVLIAHVQYLYGIATSNNTTLFAMLTDPQQGEQARIFVYTNMILPLFTGLTFFVVLQAVNVGLNALLEIDYNVRDMLK